MEPHWPRPMGCSQLAEQACPMPNSAQRSAVDSPEADSAPGRAAARGPAAVPSAARSRWRPSQVLGRRPENACGLPSRPLEEAPAALLWRSDKLVKIGGCICVFSVSVAVTLAAADLHELVRRSCQSVQAVHKYRPRGRPAYRLISKMPTAAV